MNVPFQLRRHPEGPRQQAVAAWFPGRDVAALLELCGSLGLDPTGRVFDLADGFLLKLGDKAATDRRLALAGAVRLRSLAANLFLPVDADLTPAVLEDESTAFVRDRGLVFLPGGRVLGFDPRAPRQLASLLTAEPFPRPPLDWQALPESIPLASRIEEIVVEDRDDSPDDVFEAGTGGMIGVESPRPQVSGPTATAFGKAALGAGKILTWLGKRLGLKGIAELGTEWVHRALKIAPRLSEDLVGRQAAALRDLLRQFREGDIENALKHSLPLSTPGESRGLKPYGSDVLPPRDLSYSLGGLLNSTKSSLWFGGQDIMVELTREYRKAAEEALRKGDYRRAAAIYSKLLRDDRSAAHALLRGGLNHDAGIIFLARLNDPRAAARAFEAAGEIDRALGLYRKLADHESAGDLLRRVGEDDAALAEYRIAADHLARHSENFLAAGNLLFTKGGRPDLAIELFREGWKRRPLGNAVPCVLRIARIHAETGDAPALLTLVDQADAHFGSNTDLVEAGRFYNTLASFADRKELESVRETLRDRARLGLAVQLRQRALPGEKGAPLVSSLLGNQGVWPAAVVSDASFAVATATRLPDGLTRLPRDPSVFWHQVHEGTVTAVTSAAISGEVILGFETGEVFAYRPGRSETVLIAASSLPVKALATDPKNEHVVILRSDGPGCEGILSGFERRSDGTYALMLGARTSALLDPWMTPIEPLSDESVFALWDGCDLVIMSATSLTVVERFLQEFDLAPTSPAGLILPTEEEDWLILLHDSSEWIICDRESTRSTTGLRWCPQPAAGSPLRSIPLSWAAFTPGQIDLAGLGESGSVHWARLQDGELIARNEMPSPTEGGYLAAAIVRDGLIAALTRDRIEWLRCGPSKFQSWRSTPLAIPSAVACAANRSTDVLVIVTADGAVARVSIPV